MLRECIVNLARIKEAVSIAVQKPGDFPPQGLDNVPQLLRGITAGLLMLGKGRAVELMDAIGVQVRMLIEPGAPTPDALRLERVADAIVSIEYYMETLQSGRTDPWYMLDNAEMCIKTLAEEAPSRVPNIEISEQRCRQDRQARSGGDHRSGAHQAGARGHQSIDRGARARTRRSAIRRAVHRGSQGRDRLDSEQLPAMGPESHGFGIVGPDAPQLSHAEGQRPHGRRPRDRGVRLVDREFAESNHRQDTVAHAGNDGSAAQRRRGSAAVGGTVGDGARTIRCRSKR